LRGKNKNILSRQRPSQPKGKDGARLVPKLRKGKKMIKNLCPSDHPFLSNGFKNRLPLEVQERAVKRINFTSFGQDLSREEVNGVEVIYKEECLNFVREKTPLISEGVWEALVATLSHKNEVLVCKTGYGGDEEFEGDEDALKEEYLLDRDTVLHNVYTRSLQDVTLYNYVIPGGEKCRTGEETIFHLHDTNVPNGTGQEGGILFSPAMSYHEGRMALSILLNHDGHGHLIGCLENLARGDEYLNREMKKGGPYLRD